MHDNHQVIELMGTHDFTQLQQQTQQQQTQMLNYTMTETQNIPTAAQQQPQQQQHATDNNNQDNNRSSRPIRRTSRRTPQVSSNFSKTLKFQSKWAIHKQTASIKRINERK